MAARNSSYRNEIRPEARYHYRDFNEVDHGNKTCQCAECEKVGGTKGMTYSVNGKTKKI